MLVDKSDMRLNIVGFEVDSARRRDVAELGSSSTLRSYEAQRSCGARSYFHSETASQILHSEAASQLATRS